MSINNSTLKINLFLFIFLQSNLILIKILTNANNTITLKLAYLVDLTK